MDRPFINKMCTAYYDDFELHKLSIWESDDAGVDELFNYIKSIMESLKVEDTQFYEELFELSKQRQYTLIYNLLESYVSDNYSDKLSVVEESDQFDQEILEFDPIGLAAGFAGTKMGMAFITLALAYFMGTTGNTAISRFVDRKLAKGAALFNGMINSISGFMKKISVGGKVRDAMIYQNAAGYCGAKCRAPKPNMIPPNIRVALKGGGVDKDTQELFKCLSNCYLSSILEGVKFIAKQYGTCLAVSGESFPTGKGPTALTSVLKTPIGEHCKSFFDELNKLHSDWEEAIKVVFKSEPRKVQEWNNKFFEALDAGLRSVQGNPGGQSKGPNQNRPQYGKRR